MEETKEQYLLEIINKRKDIIKLLINTTNGVRTTVITTDDYQLSLEIGKDGMVNKLVTLITGNIIETIELSEFGVKKCTKFLADRLSDIHHNLDKFDHNSEYVLKQ